MFNCITVYQNTTLSMLCKKIHIADVNCTCQKQTVLCEHFGWHNNSSKGVPGGEGAAGEYPHGKDVVITRYGCNKDMMYLRGISNLIISTIGIMGNLLVVAVSLRYYFMITRCNLLITILAVTDLATSSIRLWKNIPFLWTCNWIYDRYTCIIGHTVLNAASYISMGLIVMIAIERYLGIVFPFYRGISNIKLGFLLLLNAVIGLSIATPIFLYTDIKDSLCTEQWPSDDYLLIYGIVILIFFSILPAVVIGFIYYKIIKTLRESTKKLFRTSAVSFSAETKRIKVNERIMTMVITISILFVALVFPNRLFLITQGIMKIKGIRPPVWFHFTQVIFAFIVYSLHAVVNPIIYSLLDRVFRKKVAHILTCQSVSGNRTDFMRTSTCTKTSRRLTRTSNISTSCATRLSCQQENRKHSKQQLTVTNEV